MDEVPNPGSSEAIEQGCTCAVLDNHHGQGFPMTQDDGVVRASFWISQGCPLHWPS